MPSEAPPKKNAYFPGQRCGCRRLLDIMQVGICVTDAVGTIRFLNPAYAAMFKMDVKETPGRNICEFFPNSALLKVIRSGIPDRRVQFEWMGQKAFISRYPLWEDGVVVGGLIEVYSRDIDELERLLQHIRNLQKKASYYKLKTRGLLRAEYTFDMIVGSSRPMQQLQQQGKKFAQGKQPILITGESGSGKELVAHALHSASPRAEEAFVRVSCAAIPAELIEAELFGYEEGAFTGARSGGRVGRFELADRGTIFLDEIGEMTLPMQAKLLRVLEHGEIQKVGKSGRSSRFPPARRQLTRTSRQWSARSASGPTCITPEHPAPARAAPQGAHRGHPLLTPTCCGSWSTTCPIPTGGG